MLAPKQTRLTENSKTLILLEKENRLPETIKMSMHIPEILMVSENYDDPKLPQEPFVFKSPIPLKIFSKKERTMIIPLLNLSPVYMLWFALVKDCDVLKEKIGLLRKYCTPDVVILKTRRCEVDGLSKEFGKPIQREFIEPLGNPLSVDFLEMVFHDGMLYVIR